MEVDKLSKFKKLVSMTLCFLLTFLLLNTKAYAETYKLIPYRVSNITCYINTNFDYTYLSKDINSLNHDYNTICCYAAGSWDYKLSLYDIPGNCDVVFSGGNSQVSIMDTSYFDEYTYALSGPNINDPSHWTMCVDGDKCDSETQNAVQFVFAHEIGHHYGLDDLGFWDSWEAVMSEYTNMETYYEPQYNDMMGVKASYNLN